MAKKIRKRRTNPWRLFVLILIPWGAMAAAALAARAVGLSDEVAVGVALGFALFVTYLIYRWQERRKASHRS